MKKIIIFFILIFITSFSKNGQWILNKLDKNIHFDTTYCKSKMIIINKEKITSTMNFEIYTKKYNNNDFQLLKYYYPARLKGTAILSKNNNIWYYNKRTNRIRLLSKSAKKGNMMGSSFSYDDMNLNYLTDFKSEIIKEDKNTFILKLYPKDNDKKYKYLKLYLDKKRFLASKIKYFDINEIEYKTLEITNYKKIDEKYYENKIKMTNNISNKVTIIECLENTLKVDMSISDSQFSERNLKR